MSDEKEEKLIVFSYHLSLITHHSLSQYAQR
jgi:hypothetical protein